MNGKEAKRIFIEYSQTQLEDWGFKEKKSRTTSAFFIKDKSNGFEEFTFSTFNYYPEVVCTGGAHKFVKQVEDVLKDVNDKYSLGLKLGNETFTFVFFGNRSNLKLNLLEVENKDKEKGVIESSKIILNFYEEALSNFDLFDDLRELDKRINGKGENFWEDDIGTSKPFNLGGKFFYRRFIIARLSKSDKDFNLFFEFWLDFVNKRSIEKSGKIALDKNDLEHYVMKFILYLQEHVSPIY